MRRVARLKLAPYFGAMLLRLCHPQPPPPPPGKGGPVGADPDTHPDFQPRMVLDAKITQDEVDSIKQDIRETIRSENVVIFMKGVPEAPVCGFSKKMVDVMDALGLEYTSFDVLAHPVVRSYVKELSDWPTIPQLFVKGDFVGGIDVVERMAAEGDLQRLLQVHGIPIRDSKWLKA